MSFIYRNKFKLIILLIAALVLYAGFIQGRSMLIASEHPLEVRWEGFYHDMNFRDIGQSINQCYHEDIMKTGVVFRSNGWFSGWDCEKVGEPDNIVSLNYDPAKNKQFFCWDDDREKAVVGIVPYSKAKISDPELLETWDDADKREAGCRAVESVMKVVLSGGKTLIHCDAGRDRTGWMAALLGMIVFDSYSINDDRAFNAVECDYRKTESLGKYKYGRMASFFKKLNETSSVSDFLEKECGIDKKMTAEVAYVLSDNSRLASNAHGFHTN